MLGIDQTKESLVVFSGLVCEGIEIAKDGVNLFNFHKLFSLMNEIRHLATSAKPVFEELKDLDSQEARELSLLSLELVKKMVAELAA